MAQDQHPVPGDRVPVGGEAAVVGEGEGADGEDVQVAVSDPRDLRETRRKLLLVLEAPRNSVGHTHMQEYTGGGRKSKGYMMAHSSSCFDALFF